MEIVKNVLKCFLRHAHILLKSQLSAQERWKCKMVLQIRKVPSAIGTGIIKIK